MKSQNLFLKLNLKLTMKRDHCRIGGDTLIGNQEVEVDLSKLPPPH